MRLLPLSTYTFLDTLIAKLEADATDAEQPDDARQELRVWAAPIAADLRTKLPGM